MRTFAPPVCSGVKCKNRRTLSSDAGAMGRDRRRCSIWRITWPDTPDWQRGYRRSSRRQSDRILDTGLPPRHYGPWLYGCFLARLHMSLQVAVAVVDETTAGDRSWAECGYNYHSAFPQLRMFARSAHSNRLLTLVGRPSADRSSTPIEIATPARLKVLNGRHCPMWRSAKGNVWVGCGHQGRRRRTPA